MPWIVLNFSKILTEHWHPLIWYIHLCDQEPLNTHKLRVHTSMTSHKIIKFQPQHHPTLSEFVGVKVAHCWGPSARSKNPASHQIWRLVDGPFWTITAILLCARWYGSISTYIIPLRRCIVAGASRFSGGISYITNFSRFCCPILHNSCC